MASYTPISTSESNFSWTNILNHYFTNKLIESQINLKLTGRVESNYISTTSQVKLSPCSFYIAFVDQIENKVILVNSTTGAIFTAIKPLNNGIISLCLLSQKKLDSKITAIEFHKKINAIFLGLNSCQIELRDFENNKIINEYQGPKKDDFEYVDIQCSNSAKYFGVASSIGFIYLFEHNKPSVFWSNKNPIDSKITSISLTENDESLICVSLRDIRIWKINNLEKMEEVVKLFESNFVPKVICQTNQHFFVNVNTHKIVMYDMKTKQILKFIKGDKKSKLVSFMVSKDEKILISLTADGIVRFYDLGEMEEITLIKLGVSDTLETLLLSQNQKFFCLVFVDGSLKGWNLMDEMITSFNQNDYMTNPQISTAILDKNNRYLIIGTKQGFIQIFDLKLNEIICSVEESPNQAIGPIRLTLDERILIAAVKDDTFKFFSFQIEASTKLQEIYTSPKISGKIQELLIIQNKFLIVRFTPNKINIYDLKTYNLHQTLEFEWWKAHVIFNQINTCFAERNLVIGGDDGSLTILEFDDNDFKVKECFSNVFSTPITANYPTENFIVVGSYQAGLKILFLKTKTINTLPFNKNKGGVYSIDVSFDGLYIIACSFNTISLYDARLQFEIHSFTTESDILKVTFTSDAKGIIILYVDGNVKIQKFPFFNDLNDLNVIDHTLPVPYRALSTIPKFKVMRLWNSDIKITPHLIQSFSALYTNPYKINFWHYYFLTQDLEESSSVVKMMIDANIPILNDMNGKNIIHYLLKKKNKTALNIIFKHAEQAFQHSPPEVFDSFSLLLPEIIATGLPYLPSFLDVCVGPPEVVEGRHLPRFGDANGQAPFVLSLDRKLRSHIRTSLIKEGADPVTFYTSKVSINADFTSEENMKLLEQIFNYGDASIFSSGLILKIIERAWSKALPYIFFLVLDSFLFLIFLMTYAAYGMSFFWLEITLFVHNCFLLFHEFLQFLGHYKTYFRSFWNICDLIRLTLIFSSVALRWRNDRTPNGNDGDDTIGLLLVLGFFFNYIKLLSYLRIFTATRRFIRLLAQIFITMLPFIVLVCIIIIAFSFIFFQVSLTVTFSSSLKQVYRMLFGDFDAIDHFTMLRNTFFTIISFLTNVVLMNLLIAFLAETRRRTEAHALSSDCYEKLDLVLEILYTKKTFKKILCINRILKANTPERPRQYLFWVVETSPGDENRRKFAWEGRIWQTKKEFNKEVVKEYQDTENQLNFILGNLHIPKDVQMLMKKTIKKQDKTLENISYNQTKTKTNIQETEKQVDK